LELWVAARTDVNLRTAMIPLERKVSDALAVGGAELFGDRYTPEELELSIELARGHAVSRILRSPAAHREYIDRLLPIWKDLLNHDSHQHASTARARRRPRRRRRIRRPRRTPPPAQGPSGAAGPRHRARLRRRRRVARERLPGRGM